MTRFWRVTSIVLIVLFVLVGFLAFFTHYYPLRHRAHIIHFSHEYNLDASMVAALINTESSFKQDAISSSDAIGLMQLKLSTAKEIGEKLGEELKEEMLFNPSINIRYGCFYLRFLLDYYENNLTNALYAYNAGLNNVNNWLAKENKPKRLSVTYVPFLETRNYHIRINKYYKIYKYFYGM